MRLSLRELLVLVALVALAIASLKYASDTWLTIVVAVTMLALFVAVIVAAIDRGPRQAFAIGFALTMAGYGLIVINGTVITPNRGSTNLEFDQYSGHLPTTRLLGFVHMAVNDSRWVDFRTGIEIPGYDPTKAGAGGVGGMPSVGFKESPPREIFMPIGHCWWGLLLGYIGGLFAAFVYSRRLREQQSAKV